VATFKVRIHRTTTTWTVIDVEATDADAARNHAERLCEDESELDVLGEEEWDYYATERYAIESVEAQES
jgi:hypothetical protein